MKKTLITVAFLQCLNLCGMRTIPTGGETQSQVTTLVTANFFENEITRFSQDITAEIARVNSGTATVEQAIVSITGNCRTWFDLCRAQINERYMGIVVAQQRQTQLDIQATITAKDQEIRVLQQRLDTLLSAHTEGLEGLSSQLRIFDQQRAESEQQVRTARDRVDSSSTAELVTETQLRRTMDRLTRDLGIISTEIQDGTRTLEDAFARAEEKYSDSIETLLRSLEDRYADVLSGVAERSTERIAHLTEAYERQIELIRRMLDEAVAATRVAEEAKIRRTKIGRILGEYRIDPRDFLKYSSEEIVSLELSKRHKLLLPLLTNIFLPFSEFLDADELLAVSQYTTAINVPMPRCELGDFNGYYYGMGYYGYTEWCYFNVDEMRRAQMYGANIPGHYDVAAEDHWKGGPLRFWANSVHAPLISAERERINADIRREKENYETAKMELFPSEVFSRLITQINNIFKEFI